MTFLLLLLLLHLLLTSQLLKGLFFSGVSFDIVSACVRFWSKVVEEKGYIETKERLRWKLPRDYDREDDVVGVLNRTLRHRVRNPALLGTRKQRAYEVLLAVMTLARKNIRTGSFDCAGTAFARSKPITGNPE